MGRKYKNRQTSKQSGGAPHQLLVIIVTFLLGYFTATVFDIGTVSHWVNTQVLAHHDEQKRPAREQAKEQAQIPAKHKFEFYTLLANEKTAGSSQTNADAATDAAKSIPSAAHTTSQPTQASTSTNPAAVVVSHAASAAAPAVLTKKAVPVIQAQAVKITSSPVVQHAPPPSRALQKTPGAGFGIQVASFRSQKDAQQMKGRLTLKGYGVQVVPVSQAQGNWFRVVVGPYSNKTLAQRTQVALARNERVQGMVIRFN